MKKLLIITLCFLPSAALADQLGGLLSTADVLLTTQTATGDNLGNHIATTVVNMASFGINNIGTSSAVFNTNGSLTISSITANNSIDLGTPGSGAGFLRIGRGAAASRNLMLTGTGTTGLAEFDKTGLSRTPLLGTVLTIDSEDSTSSSYATYERNATAGGTTIIFATRSDQRVAVATNIINAQLDVVSSAIGNKGLIVQGFNGQTANLSEWQNNVGTILILIDKSGNFLLGQNTLVDAVNNIFQVGTSTTVAYTSTGHLEFHASTSPSIGSCGAGASIASGSSDVTGTFTMGTLTVACTLTFSQTWKNIPQCFGNDETGVNAVKFAPTVNNVVITTAGSGGDVVDYLCIGEQ